MSEGVVYRLTRVVDIEPLFARSKPCAAQVPFADARRRVARRLEMFCQRRLLERQLLADDRVQELL